MITIIGSNMGVTVYGIGYRIRGFIFLVPSFYGILIFGYSLGEKIGYSARERGKERPGDRGEREGEGFC